MDVHLPAAPTTDLLDALLRWHHLYEPYYGVRNTRRLHFVQTFGQSWLLGCRLGAVNKAWHEAVLLHRQQVTTFDCSSLATMLRPNGFGHESTSKRVEMAVQDLIDHEWCPRLQNITISGQFRAKTLTGLAHSVPLLESLNLSSDRTSTGGFALLTAFARNCPNLREVCLGGGNPHSESPSLGDGIVGLAHCCPRIVTLELSSYPGDALTLTDSMIQRISILLPQLEWLGLAELGHFGNAAFHPPASFPNLKHLTLVETGVSDGLFDQLHMPSLDSLHVQGTEISGSRIRLAYLPSLTCLTLSEWSANVTDTCAALAMLPKLQDLDEVFFNGGGRAVAMALSTCCKGLQTLCLGEDLCTAQHLQLLAPLQLKYLSLYAPMAELSDPGLRVLADTQKSLKRVAINTAHGPSLTATGIKDLVAGCPVLTRVILDRNPGHNLDDLECAIAEAKPEFRRRIDEEMQRNPNYDGLGEPYVNIG